MTTTTEALHEAVDKIAKQRDELRLQMHLAKADAKAEWERAEEKWNDVQRHLARARKATGKKLEDIRTAMGAAADEIASAYGRIRTSLSK